ncbi:MAG: hypothetical protein WCD66_06940 [Rhodanobacteraceae bacterium]
MAENYRQLVAGVALEKMQPAPRHWDQEMREPLDRIPMAQPSRAAVDLSNLLLRMLEVHGDGSSRVRILQAVQGLAQPLLDGLYKQIMAESHPLPVAKADLAQRLLALRSAQGKNTSMAVWELAGPDGKLPLFGRGQIIETLNDALALHRDVLELSFQLYQEPPQGTWRRLHALYGFAVDSSIAERKCLLAGERHKLTARQRYAHALLLAMANPWGMQRAELAQALQITASLADRVRFGPGPNAVPANGHGEDSGPGFDSTSGDGMGAVGVMVDLGPVLEIVDQQLSWDSADALVISLADGHGGQTEVRRSMLKRMSRAWHGRTERGFDRVGAKHVMSVLVGMSAIHQAMAGGDDFEAFRERLVGDQGHANVGGNAAAWLSGHAAAAPLHVEARVLDQSLGGYRLLWPPGHGHRVRIGELVGLLPGHVQGGDEDGSSLLMLGVLRWLRSMGNDELAVGVELLSRQPRPALVRIMDTQGQRGPLGRGLLIDADAEDKELVIARVRDSRIDGVEVSCLPGDDSSGSVGMQRRKFEIVHAQELSPAYYRVSLSDSDSLDSQSTAP